MTNARAGRLTATLVMTGSSLAFVACSILVDTSGLAGGTSFPGDLRGDGGDDGDGGGEAQSSADANDGAAGSRIAFVKNLGTYSTAGATTASVTVTSGAVQGNVVVVRAALDADTSAASSGFAVTDTQGNTYVSLSSHVDPAVVSVVFAAKLTTALPSGGVITLSFLNGSSVALAADEFSGVDSVLDVQNTAFGEGATAASLSATTTDGERLLISNLGLWGQGAVSVGLPPDWSGLVRVDGPGGPGRAIKDVAAYKTLTAAGSQTFGATFSEATAWAANFVALKGNP